MNNSDGLKQDKHGDIPRLLKKLPKIEASDDFEQQLQRRISSEKDSSVQPGFLEKIFRASAIGYSLAAFFLICALSLYIMYRTRSLEFQGSQNIPGISSQPLEDTKPPLETVKPAPPSQLQQNEKASPQNRGIQNPPSIEKRTALSSEHREVNMSGKKEGEFSATDRGNQRKEEINGMDKQAPSNAGKAQPEIDNIAQPASEPPHAAKSDSKLRTVKKQVVPSLGVSSEVKMIAPAFQVDSVEALKSLAPSIMRSKVSPIPSFIMGKRVQPLKDSITRADSLRLDSLKRIKKTRDSIETGLGNKPR